MKKLLLIGLILLCWGCMSTKKNNAYKEFKSQILEEASKNFPLKGDAEIENSEFLIINYPATIDTLRFCGIFIGKSYSDKNFKKSVKIIHKEYKKIVLSEQRCLKYIPENNISKKGLCNEIILPNVTDSLIVPNRFLSDNVSYYIKNEKKGNFLETKYSQFYKSNHDFYHGYSSGAVVDNDSNKIVYWLIIK
jgi:hypothetical protein